jgi:hypothetical protein
MTLRIAAIRLHLEAVSGLVQRMVNHVEGTPKPGLQTSLKESER